uniref:AB hydrolase-1 domain-containing protein n=1 Tax=Chenopodium quinoa TaxID=63459 RepID=A0A803N8I3_CHEQI
MSSISTSSAVLLYASTPAISEERRSTLRSDWFGTNLPFKSVKSTALRMSCSSTSVSNGLTLNMALVDERLTRNVYVGKQFGTLAYDLVQGALVKWSSLMDKSVPEPPTAVLIHGILGCRKNWDLRCHGDSASITKGLPNTVAAAGRDVLNLVAQLQIIPRVLVGHSFGGKVVLSMVEQAAKPLARPVRVWVLDATPGKVKPGGHGEDHPAELISFLRKMPEKKIPSKQYVLDALVHEGFSKDVAQLSDSFIRPYLLTAQQQLYWRKVRRGFDLFSIRKIVEDVPRGVHVNFLKAERSLHRWALEDIRRIHAAEEVAVDEGGGVQMHVLEDAGHWVHTDNPDGLFKILSSSFEGFTTQL